MGQERIVSRLCSSVVGKTAEQNRRVGEQGAGSRQQSGGENGVHFREGSGPAEDPHCTLSTNQPAAPPSSTLLAGLFRENPQAVGTGTRLPRCPHFLPWEAPLCPTRAGPNTHGSLACTRNGRTQSPQHTRTCDLVHETFTRGRGGARGAPWALGNGEA